MKYLLISILFIIQCTLLYGQAPEDVKFESGLNWAQVKDRARTENKYIFIDCFATWCGPCKLMDQNVYTDKNVAAFINAHFISVKVQMDKTGKDDDMVARWYNDANQLKVAYNVTAFPSFLFFSPDGQVVHKGAGYQIPKNFIKLVQDALEPSRQYYTLLREYKNGNLAFPLMALLTHTAQALGDKDTAQTIASAYVAHIGHLQQNEVYTKENLQFINEFQRNTKSNGFNFFYRHENKVDSVMNDDGFAQNYITSAIEKDILFPVIWPQDKPITGQPEWVRLESGIAKRYTKEYAARAITDVKIKWFSAKNDWPHATKYLVQYTDRFASRKSMGNGFILDNTCWAIFVHSTNKEELSKAISWMESLFKNHPEETQIPEDLDTYANLLYKAGRVNDGITWEEKAVERGKSDTTFQRTLNKMKNGKPTWIGQK